MPAESPPPNPYAAPSATLGPEVAPPQGTAQSTGWKSGRLAALVLAVLAYPLAGVGFYVLGRRRRLVCWIAAALCTWVLAIVAGRLPAPKLCVFAFAGLTFVALAALVDILVAGPSTPPKGRVLLIAVLLVIAGRGGSFAVKRWLIEPFSIPSATMAPTLLAGDHIMVRKGQDHVARGDVVVFAFPLDETTDYVKRIVAVGGDTIEVSDGVVVLNGVALEQTEIEGECPPLEQPGPCKLLRETNAGRSYTIVRDEDHPAPQQLRTVIPDGHVFVMGDNRDNSYDSRTWGPLRVDYVRGLATVTWWSVAPNAGVRWSRVGRGID
jgi:signal peptidase I